MHKRTLKKVIEDVWFNKGGALVPDNPKGKYLRYIVIKGSTVGDYLSERYQYTVIVGELLDCDILVERSLTFNSINEILGWLHPHIKEESITLVRKSIRYVKRG